MKSVVRYIGMHSAGRRGTEKQGGTEQEHRGRGRGGGGKYGSTGGGVQGAGGSMGLRTWGGVQGAGGSMAQLQLLAYQIRGIHNFY